MICSQKVEVDAKIMNFFRRKHNSIFSLSHRSIKYFDCDITLFTNHFCQNNSTPHMPSISLPFS